MNFSHSFIRKQFVLWSHKWWLLFSGGILGTQWSVRKCYSSLVMRYGLLTTVNQAHIIFCGKNVPYFIPAWTDFKRSVHALIVCGPKRIKTHVIALLRAIDLTQKRTYTFAVPGLTHYTDSCNTGVFNLGYVKMYLFIDFFLMCFICVCVCVCVFNMI